MGISIGCKGAAPFLALRRHVFLSGSAIILVLSSPAQAADVEITSNTASVDLDTYVGTTARIWPSVTVASGVSATTQAWTVTNDGTVNGGNSVKLDQGGTFTNSAGATVNGTLTAMAFGYKPFALPPAGGPGTLYNYGTIAGTVEAVTMWFGGTVTNYQGGIISTTGSGNAISVGQGASRTVINSGEIHADKTTGFSTGILVQGGPATVTNNATGVITGGYNGVYASASTPLTFTNNGSITSVRGPAVEAAGGGTFINTGTIQSGVDAMKITGAAIITNTGTIGSTGAGRAVAFSGAAIHTLNLGTGSVLNGNVAGGTGTDNLVLQGSGTESAAKFSSFETLAMQGSAWTLTGTGAFTTSTTVSSGTLSINGTLTSPTVTVQSGGTLGGTGTVVGAVTNNGIVAPGNSIGTLNITGNYTQASGSTLRVEINNTPAADLLNITGTATIQSGATVNVLPASGLYAVGSRYTILTATGGRTGTYDNLVYNAPFLGLSLAYDPNNVFLDVTRSSVAFSQVAQTPNQSAAASGAESLGPGNPVYNSIVGLAAGDAQRAFDQLSGEIHASVQNAIVESARFPRDAILGRLRQDATGGGATQIATATLGDADSALAYAGRARHPLAQMPHNPAAPVLAAWAQGYGETGRTGGDGNAAGATRRTGGFITGVDLSRYGMTSWRIGLAAGYQQTGLSVADRASSATIDSYNVALYGGVQHGPLGLRAGAAYGWNNVTALRTIAFPGFADATRATYSSGVAQVFGEAGYRIPVGRISVEPFAALAGVFSDSGRFVEAGGAAALTGASARINATFSTLGLRASLPFAFGNNPASLQGSLGWRHAFTGTPVTTMTFNAGGAAFPIAGVPFARDVLAAEAGIDLRLSPQWSAGVFYTGQYASRTGDHGVRGQIAFRF